MSDDFCPRQIVFTIPGNPGVQVTATENGGKIDFIVDVQEGATTADLRALFFHFTEAKLSGLTFTETGGTSLLTETRVQANAVIDMGQGANLNGGGVTPFDIGMEWGTPGGAKDDISGPVTFTLSRAANDLTLDDIGGKQFGANLDSVGGPGGPRNGVSKIVGDAPHAPDALDDSFTGFEDGAAGLDAPSKAPVAIKLDVLANDTDGDGNTLVLLDTFHDGPAHGQVTTDGEFLYYTPDADWSGTDTFEYCVSDGAGGQDHAMVTVKIDAVADEPLITYEVAPGANVNEILLTVTATQDDADSSEFLDKIEVGLLPAGVTVTPMSVDPVAEGDQLVQVFKVTTPAQQDLDFALTFTATSKETSNGDTEANSVSVPIVIEYNENDFSQSFLATDQSIWDSGDAFSFTDDRFLGVDTSFSDSEGGLIGYSIDASLKAGFQSTLKFEGGEIDANLDYDLGVDTTLNKTTDTLQISTSAFLTNGGFSTVGPSGSYKLDFIFNYNFDAALTYDIGVDSGDIIGVDIGDDLTQNILNLDSDDLGGTINFPPPFGSLSATLAWPNIATSGSGSPPPDGEFTGTGASNNFLQLNLDVDQALADIFLGGANPLDVGFDIGIVWGNLELADLDVFGGLNFLQEFVMQAEGLTGVLHFEDGQDVAFTFGTDFTLQNASDIDANGDGDGLIEFTVELDAQADLTNDTDLGVNVGYNLDLLKVSGGYDVGVDSGSFSIGPAFNANDSTGLGEVDLYNATFAMNFAPESFLIAA
jgi:hypothetical protein